MFNFGDESVTYNFSPTKELIKKQNILNSCCFFTVIKRSNKNFKNIAKNVFCLAPEFSKKFLNLYNKKLQLACGVTITSSWEQEPDYYNRVELSNTEKDIFNFPLAKLVYKKSELVRKTARVCMQEIGKFLIKNNLGRVSINDFLFEDNKKYLSEAGWHHLGGTVMGESIKNSVVDKNLKIHGSKNFYVLGSSVFPTGGHANPTLTIIQLALRLAERLSV
jgi:choline dehydrogenase-like flavoprotein